MTAWYRCLLLIIVTFGIILKSPCIETTPRFYLSLFNCFYRAFSLCQCCNFNILGRYILFSRRRSFVVFHIKNFWARTDTKAAANTVIIYDVMHLTPPVSPRLTDKSLFKAPFIFWSKLCHPALSSRFHVHISFHYVPSNTFLYFYSLLIITTSKRFPEVRDVNYLGCIFYAEGGDVALNKLNLRAILAPFGLCRRQG